MKSYFTGLICTKCKIEYSGTERMNLCPDCGGPLFATYELNKAGEELNKETIAARPSGEWQFYELLPVINENNVVSLTEGGTPVYHAEKLGKVVGLSNLYIKDESPNPTGSFKARGVTAAVSKAKELGITKVSLPTAGNAGGAVAAYGAKAGMDVLIAMPEDTPDTFKTECKYYGAEVVEIDGVITDAGAYLTTRKDEGWFDFSTLKEPYRVEGKKIMGYELAVDFKWTLPDVVIYPTGGGTGLIGMWKAFDEMEKMGWIGKKRPKMISIQADGCPPIIDAFKQKLRQGVTPENPDTVAMGLRVPKAVGDFLILDALYESGGYAEGVAEDDIIWGTRMLSQLEGIFPAPEGGAAVGALPSLIKKGIIRKDEKVVIFNTGSGLKYTEILGKLV